MKKIREQQLEALQPYALKLWQELVEWKELGEKQLNIISALGARATELGVEGAGEVPQLVEESKGYISMYYHGMGCASCPSCNSYQWKCPTRYRQALDNVCRALAIVTGVEDGTVRAATRVRERRVILEQCGDVEGQLKELLERREVTPDGLYAQEGTEQSDYDLQFVLDEAVRSLQWEKGAVAALKSCDLELDERVFSSAERQQVEAVLLKAEDALARCRSAIREYRESYPAFREQVEAAYEAQQARIRARRADLTRDGPRHDSYDPARRKHWAAEGRCGARKTYEGMASEPRNVEA